MHTKPHQEKRVVTTSTNAWNATKNTVVRIVPIWKPTGRRFNLHDIFGSRTSTEPIVKPSKLTPCVSPSTNATLNSAITRLVPMGYVASFTDEVLVQMIKGVVQPIAPTTAKQRLARKNELKARDEVVLVSEGSPETTTERYTETYKNVPQDLRDQLNAKAKAIQIILTRIDNDIYFTVDACPNSCEMWKAIESFDDESSYNIDFEEDIHFRVAEALIMQLS
nr:hypothetical protein [Tanacetum cinerariifolium]